MIGLLATGGVVVSTVVLATLAYIIFWLCGISVPFIYCLVFGSLIAPTDAVMVLLFLKNTTLPEAIKSKITGESLLNDGMSIMLFTSLLAIATHQTTNSLTLLPIQIGWSIVGSIVVGVCSGHLARIAIRHAAKENPYTPILITLALATGSYTLAGLLATSGPIAVVVAGLYLGNTDSLFVSEQERAQLLASFWDLLDELLNAVLFVIIGLELLSISTVHGHLLAALCIVPAALAARYISIVSVIKTIPSFTASHPYLTNILTWGGLRCGISIALVLSLPPGMVRDVLMTATYALVIFSVFVQGPTLSYVVKKNTA